MPVIGGNPENLRDDLQAQAIADTAAAEAEEAANPPEPKPFDPVDVVRQMRGEPAEVTAEAHRIAAQIRQNYGY